MTRSAPHLFPGMEITSSILDEGIAVYSMNFLEVFQALGVFGIIGIMLVLGIMIFAMVPTEVRVCGESQTFKHLMPKPDQGAEPSN